MLHCCLSVVCLLQPGSFLKRCNLAGCKFYRMVGQGLGSYGAERHPKDGTVSGQWRLQWGVPVVSRRPRYSNQEYFRFYRQKEASDSKTNGTLL